MNMRGTVRTQVMKLIQLARRNLTLGNFMICKGIYGNGFKTSGMIIMKVLLLMVMLGKMEVAIFVWYVVAAGTNMPGTAGQLPALGASPTATASASVS